MRRLDTKLSQILFVALALALTGCGENAADDLVQPVPKTPSPPKVQVPTPSPAPTLPTPPSPKGFVSLRGIGYYVNEVSEYCQFIDFNHWLKSGGPEDVSGTEIASLPSNLKFDGACALRGFFSKGTVGYYANELGQYCQFLTWGHWVASGGPEENIPSYNELPEMTYGGDCPVRGFFHVAGTIYHADATQAFCAFSTWEHYLSRGGPEDVSLVLELPSIPTSLRSNGVCP